MASTPDAATASPDLGPAGATPGRPGAVHSPGASNPAMATPAAATAPAHSQALAAQVGLGAGHQAAPSPASAAPAGAAGAVPTVELGAGTRSAPALSSPVPTPSSPTPGSPPSPAAQLVSVIGPLQSSDGNHQVTLSLQPEGLGTVKATVTVDGGQVVIQLAVDAGPARAALEQALPLLRQQFSADGTNATVLLSTDLGSGGGGPDGRQARGDRRSAPATAKEAGRALEQAARSHAPTAHRLIDIQL